MKQDDRHLHVIDTSQSLTLEELKELKRIASMSKTAKALIAVAIGIIALFGIDKIITFLQSNH